MKQFALWLALLLAGVAAASLAVVHFDPAASAVEQFVSPGPLSPKHAYLANRCTSCHEPTVGVTVVNCTSCHANAERLLGRQPTMFHASIQECASCHVEHQRQSIRPLTMDHVELAKIGARTLSRASRGDPDSAVTLASLETWLDIRNPDQLDTTSAREVLNCAGCHDRKDPHFDRFGNDCAQCHAMESWLVPGYQHPSPTSKECVQCHKPPASHLMGHFSMVSQKLAGKEHARVDECFECHNTTGWNDIVDVGFSKHH
ncbi:MAG: cytochrome c3 family protein [Kofleriaceae bacterium]